MMLRHDAAQSRAGAARPRPTSARRCRFPSAFWRDRSSGVDPLSDVRPTAPTAPTAPTPPPLQQRQPLLEQTRRPSAPTTPAAAPTPSQQRHRQQQQLLLEQTAQHLLEINRRRAELQEQNAVLTREKGELAARLARAEAEARAAVEEVSRLRERAAAAANAAARAAAGAAAAAPAPAAPAPPPAPPPPPPAPAAFTIEYHSGWPRAFLHHRLLPGGPWTAPPGSPMGWRPDVDGGWTSGGGGGGGSGGGGGAGGRHVFVLEVDAPEGADGLEFALTDGAADWDSGGGNYRAVGRGGAWRVRSGRIERV